jgi:hypothetical protein
MKSKRRHEGYLLIDHRNSPGITEEVAHRAGLPTGAGRGVFETPTITCSHCQKVLVINPLRTRDREYCGKCDHYVCDQCGLVLKLGGECRTMSEIMDDVQEKAVKDEHNGIILLT